MTDKEKIRAYIESQIALLEKNDTGNPVFGVSAGVVMAELKHLLSFIDNLRSFLRGCPRTPAETFQHLRELKATLNAAICDEGHYQLLDAEGKCVVDVNSYVPDCIGECGDYIVMNIDENGQIDGFHFSQDDVDEIIKGDFNYKED